ncbi:MAG: hypothetical protein OXH60_10565 [Rhodospirillales bacterium]|nr:hypothetical protein [Rhodospirillales bacterium]
MAVIDLFSHQKQVAEGGTPDVFTYDSLPERLLVQVIHIWKDAIGPYYQAQGYELEEPPHNNVGWQYIHDTIAREHGVFQLGRIDRIDERCQTYLRKSPSVDASLDLIEMSFRYVDRHVRQCSQYEREDLGIAVTADAAIEELNERFRRAGVGYRFEGGMLIRVDSELVHSEVVLPALHFLQHKGFEGPRGEFLKAHAHFRAGETKAAVIEANNAFESTLKTICDQRGWSYPERPRASDLLKVVREKGLLPNYLDQSFDQLTATLKSGLPKVRGEEGGHGQGSIARPTPQYVAAYALHLAAAQILFLAEVHRTEG